MVQHSYHFILPCCRQSISTPKKLLQLTRNINKTRMNTIQQSNHYAKETGSDKLPQATDPKPMDNSGKPGFGRHIFRNST